MHLSCMYNWRGCKVKLNRHDFRGNVVCMMIWAYEHDLNIPNELAHAAQIVNSFLFILFDFLSHFMCGAVKLPTFFFSFFAILIIIPSYFGTGKGQFC